MWAGCDALLVCSDEDAQDRAHEALATKAEKDAAVPRSLRARRSTRVLRLRRLCPPRPITIARRPVARVVGGAARARRSRRAHRRRSRSRETAHRRRSSSAPAASSPCDPARATGDESARRASTTAVCSSKAASIELVGTARRGPARAPPVRAVLADVARRVLTPGPRATRTRTPPGSARATPSTRCAWPARVRGHCARRAAASWLDARGARRDAPRRARATLAARLGAWRALGVTTVEVKSGYGLDDDERAQAARGDRRGGRATPTLPRVVPTYLALHALPPEATATATPTSRRVATRRLPAFAAAGLVRFVDAYVDANAFTVAEAERLARRGARAGLGVRLHVGQFADVGGAELAAELGAASADHLEHVGPTRLEALAQRRHARGAPAGRELHARPTAAAGCATPRSAGVRLVVASDANPGTAPTESLPLALALAVRSTASARRSAPRRDARGRALARARTRASAARSKGLRRRSRASGTLPHEHAIVQPWGVPKTWLVLREGQARLLPTGAPPA